MGVQLTPLTQSHPLRSSWCGSAPASRQKACARSRPPPRWQASKSPAAPACGPPPAGSTAPACGCGSTTLRFDRRLTAVYPAFRTCLRRRRRQTAQLAPGPPPLLPAAPSAAVLQTLASLVFGPLFLPLTPAAHFRIACRQAAAPLQLHGKRPTRALAPIASSTARRGAARRALAPLPRLPPFAPRTAPGAITPPTLCQPGGGCTPCSPLRRLFGPSLLDPLSPLASKSTQPNARRRGTSTVLCDVSPPSFCSGARRPPSPPAPVIN